MPDEQRRPEPFALRQQQDAVGERVERRAGGERRGAAVSGQLRHQQRMAPAQPRHDGRPVTAGAAEPVHEDERRTDAARDEVAEPDAPDLGVAFVEAGDARCPHEGSWTILSLHWFS